ncbi:MAG: hypothetical protein ACI8UO_004653 [Verrucomicrobiales bacterium]|jgi:hypothetical protein
MKTLGRSVLVVLALLGFCYIFFPVSALHSNTDSDRTEQKLRALRTALRDYYSEYKKLPPIHQSDDDFAGELSGDLIVALFAVKDHSATARLNPRGIQFLTTKSGLSGIRGLSKSKNGKYQFLDPWGEPCHLFLDLNYDDKMQIPFKSGKLEIVYTTVFLISKGPDRRFGTEDDIRS